MNNIEETEDINLVQKRLEDYYHIPEKTWSSIEELSPGIFVYHDVLPTDMNIVERLEQVLDDKSNYYNYMEAMVGYGMKMPEYRDCYDFKYKKTDISHDKSEASQKLQQLWQDLYDRKVAAVKDYARKFNVGELRYWEAMNFVKYGPGQHFQEHSDNGYSYNCVVSLVAYPNDDYLGGELEFRLQGLKVKPRAGDLFIFPSNYMYPHKSLPVESGTKHSIVTMLDYSEKYHKPEFYQETGY
jgi:Rps23 Pro-64 3,4-dihydroxylase Tpa1-like proline 4-hydroxylase